MSQVVVSELRKRYNGHLAVDGVSFDVEPGQIFGLLGPNGAGKTTTVECLLGLREPDEGAITICGIDARRRPREVKQKVGAALQTTALQDKITPREALTLYGGFYATPAAPGPLLERFHLTGKADQPFDTLSGGQRQRLALALAFVHQPEVVLLDEPTAGLDPQARRELHEDILQMKQDGHTVLLTTHHLDEAEVLCDRIAIIDRGRVIAVGSPQDLMSRSAALPTVSIVTSAPLAPAAFAPIGEIAGLEGDGNRWQFQCAHVNRTVAALMGVLEAARIDVIELHVQKASLEDVFLELTTGQ
jgi:ABC-2 type transport system ATP-binding protein